MKILIVKRDKLGDMLLTSPLISHLFDSLVDAEIAVLASDYCGWVIQDDPSVSRVWTYPRLRMISLLKPLEVLRYLRTFDEIRAEKFDIAIAAGGEYSHRAVAKALEARAARTIAYAPVSHGFGPRLTDPVMPQETGHETDRMLSLAAPLGIEFPNRTIYPVYRPQDSMLASARSWLDERGLSAGQFVVLGLGTRKRLRQPSTEQILRWTAWWHSEFGLQTVFMWTPGKGDTLYPGDDDVAELVVAARRADIHPFRGGIADALGLIWNARTSVFPDSGLMHFAAASPGGVLGLFAGPSSWPAQWAPRGPRAKWLLASPDVPSLSDADLFRGINEYLEDGSSEKYSDKKSVVTLFDMS